MYHSDNHLVAAFRYRRVKVDAILMQLKFHVPFAVKRARFQNRLPRFTAGAVIPNIWIFGCCCQIQAAKAVLD